MSEFTRIPLRTCTICGKVKDEESLLLADGKYICYGTCLRQYKSTQRRAAKERKAAAHKTKTKRPQQSTPATPPTNPPKRKFLGLF